LELKRYLNPQQIKAVSSVDGPTLVIAGAGSGKTRVLTYRIAYLINQKGVDPFNILAITFTNKAAREMQKRVIELVGKIGEIMWVSTFHSFCARLLRYEVHHLGIPRNFVIYDQEDQLSLIKKCLKELDIDPKRFSPKAILAMISDAKNNLIDHEEYLKIASDHYEKIVAEVYPLYQKKLLAANALDFDDLLMYTVNVLDLFPEVRKKYQEKFKYILVDEFQDTNHAQNELVLLLGKAHSNVCVVGDDDQSIYSWRGAKVTNIMEFDKKFKGTKTIKLEQNYRSTKKILSAANSIISNNEERKKKKLWTENEEGQSISRFRAADENEEVLFVLSKIRQIKKDKKALFRDFAIFYRTNAQSRAVEEVFVKENIPYKIYGGLRFYDRKEIKDMLAYLKLISNPKDIVSLLRIINTPRRGIGKTTISKIEKHSQLEKISFMEVFYRIEEYNFLQDSIKNKILAFRDMISYFRDYAQTHSVDSLLEKIWKKTGYLKELEYEKTIDAENRIENLKELLTVTKEYEFKSLALDDDEQPDISKLEGFLEEVSLLTDIDNYDDSTDAVILMTLHNAKGLEFPYVFIIGMEEGIFPHSRSMNSLEEMEEERRLCYVGITRAKKKLFLTSALSRSIYGDTFFKAISRFTNEIPKELISDENKKNADKSNSDIKQRRIAEGFDVDEKYITGDVIEHKIWGRGEVLRVKELKDDAEIDVVFESVGLKHLLVSFAPIKKIKSGGK